MGISVGLFLMKFRVPKMVHNSSVTVQLVASQEGLSSMELVQLRGRSDENKSNV
jgi:hypothetical protein